MPINVTNPYTGRSDDKQFNQGIENAVNAAKKTGTYGSFSLPNDRVIAPVTGNFSGVDKIVVDQLVADGYKVTFEKIIDRPPYVGNRFCPDPGHWARLKVTK